ncbi:heavy metal translocating P-type ATPase [Alkalicoccus daliensis]|uniref:Cd(2+)-exporting ATPase n=1 Tax=Alkalicoccus daliensis TaxID=745820 RepID=A0A1H0HJX1_9BACI|nr:cation-translocating P-type ATPase [Alkalicoccus daliensis]SDO19333.1 Cd2+/Zn2+-exporting ATPase [Alkalicoccus daliensis]
MLNKINQYKNYLTVVTGALIVLSFFLGQAVWKDAFLIAATVIAGIPIFIKAFQALRMKSFSIELLVTIAVIGALIIGEYVESAVVTFLFLFGGYLEARTLAKTRSSLKKLMELAPQEATVIRDGRQAAVPVEEVEAGDRVIIRSGGKVPVDGKIAAGEASFIEAAITGESKPSFKGEQSSVFSGTILDSGYVEVIAEKVGDDTTFAKIIELVEEAQESKSKTEKFLDRFAQFYTPGVVVLALLVYVITVNLHLAITFLVVACPGALVIGAPVSNVAGIGNGARKGVLIKGGEAVESLAGIDTLVFDKTGTLTKGKPEVTEIKTFLQYSGEELLTLSAQAETISEHHLGKAIVREAENTGLPRAEKVQGEIIKGKGIKAQVNGKEIILGNRSLLQTAGIPVTDAAEAHAEKQERAGNTAIFAVINSEIAGIISIADQIRKEAPEALAALRENGIRRIIMLTGDNRHSAVLVAEQLKIEEVHAELLPQDKVKFIHELQAQGHKVAMAGDGINDAPAIAAADIGLAMGEGGTEISMETADVVLMADKLMQLSHAYSLAKATSRNMKQNTYFAVGTVVILLTGVLMGGIHLASGMFIHEASVLLVILNAMRLIKFAEKKQKKHPQLLPEPA